MLGHIVFAVKFTDFKENRIEPVSLYSKIPLKTCSVESPGRVVSESVDGDTYRQSAVIIDDGNSPRNQKSNAEKPERSETECLP